MFVNNIIFLIGMWGMLFAGKPENEPLLFYYLALNALIMTAWGGINFFFGGWMELGELIVSGGFESKLSTPRHPLLLVSTHATHPSALGDLIMGGLAIGVLLVWGPEGMGLRAAAASVLAFVGLFSLYVFSGSLAFFVPRGNLVATLVREMTVSMSSYPMGKIFPSGMGRLILLMTPAGAVSLLPMDWIELPSGRAFLYAVSGVSVSVMIALFVYGVGVKRFQAMSVIGAQN